MIDPISIGIGVVGAGIGAWQNYRSRRDAERKQREYEAAERERIAGVEAENRAHFERDYYGNPLEAAEAKAAITSMGEHLKEQNDIADSRAAITGAGHEARLAQRASGQKAFAELARSLAANGTQMKQNAKNAYWTNKNGLSAQSAAVNSNSNSAWQSIYASQSQSGNNLQEKGMQLLGNVGGSASESEWWKRFIGQ